MFPRCTGGEDSAGNSQQSVNSCPCGPGREQQRRSPEPALLAQLARISQHDLRLPLVLANLPRHTDALAAEGRLWGPEFRAVLSIDDRGEGGIRRGLPQVQQRRLRLRLGLILGGRHHAADRGGFSDAARRVLGAERSRHSREGP